MVTAATAEMRVDPVAGLHDEEAAGDMQQEDALALALLNEDEAGGEDATTTARRLRPLYPPGQYPLHESICDIWYRCCTCCKRQKCSKLCWKLTCRLCMDWLAKESAYLTSSPRIVHAFAASCFAAIVLAIITGSAGVVASRFAVPETGDSATKDEMQAIITKFGIWTAYPAAFSVLVSLMIVPSALALSQRRLFFWLLLLVPACIAHGSMSVYGIMLEHELYSIATARMHKCTEIRMVECDRWALRNLAEDFAPMADTAVAFGFLMFFVLGFNVYLALRMIGNFKLWVSERRAAELRTHLEGEDSEAHVTAVSATADSAAEMLAVAEQAASGKSPSPVKGGKAGRGRGGRRGRGRGAVGPSDAVARAPEEEAKSDQKTGDSELKSPGNAVTVLSPHRLGDKARSGRGLGAGKQRGRGRGK